MKRKLRAEHLSLTHSKKRGEWVELQFMARASQHGLVVCKPWGDSNRFDFVVEHQGKFHRVQVKSTRVFKEGRNGRRGAYKCRTVSATYGDNNKPYSADEIDFFAFYLIPEDIWYVVPMALAKRAIYAVTLDPHQPDNKYFKYMEAWHLLKCGKS